MDLDLRLEWRSVFFQPVTPDQFMLPLHPPNYQLTSQQMWLLGDIIQRYRNDGSGDTTRQNVQLRGVRLEDLPNIFRPLKAADMTSVPFSFDKLGNITGSPVAGIDADKVVDTHPLARQLQDMVTNNNNIAFVPAQQQGEIDFDVLVRSYLLAQLCAEGVPLNVWVKPNHEALRIPQAILTIYTTHGLAEGLRESGAKALPMWLIDQWSLDRFRAEMEREMGHLLLPAAPTTPIDRNKQDYIGIHPPKQAGYVYVGLHVSGNRLSAKTMFELTRPAEVYGNLNIRLTVEQNAILPFITEDQIELLLKEPLLQQVQVAPSPLSGSLVSCIGKKYRNLAPVETKDRGMTTAQQVDARLDIPKRVRIHQMGCPNSYGHVQAGDIGLIGTKARKNGKLVEGVGIYTGGKVGKDARLGELMRKSVPCNNLLDVLKELAIEQFGASPKNSEMSLKA